MLGRTRLRLIQFNTQRLLCTTTVILSSMTRISNREERREEIAEAAWRMIEQRGLEEVSMREIAREAGYSTGVLTHHFRDKRELMGYAYGLLVGRIAERVTRAVREEGLFEALCELLPLDEGRHREAAVWIALIGASLRDPGLAEDLRRRYKEALAVGMSAARQSVGEEVVSEEDFEDVADELMVVVDGIALEAITDPDRYPPSRQVVLLRRAFDRMELPSGSSWNSS